MLSDLYVLEPESLRWSRPTAAGKAPRPRAGHTCTAIGPSPSLVPPSTSLSSSSTISQAASTPITSSTNTKDLNSHSTLHTSSLTSSSSSSSASSSASTSSRNCEDSPRRSTNGNSNENEESSSPPPTTIQTPHTNGTSNQNAHTDDNPSSTSTHDANQQAAAVPQPSQRLLYFGGGDNEGLMNDLHLLEVDTLTWSPVFTAGSSPSPRSRHTATLVKSILWVIGGLCEGQTVSNDVFTLNTISMVWSKPAIKGTPMTPRWGHSAIRSGSLIVIFGGHSGSEVMNDLHILDTETNTWKILEQPQVAIPPTAPLTSSSASTSFSELPPVNESFEPESSTHTDHSGLTSHLSNSLHVNTGDNNCSINVNNSSSNVNNSSINGSLTPVTTTSSASSGGNQQQINSQSSTSNQQVQQSLPSTLPPLPRCGHSANFVLMGRERKMIVFGGSNTASEVFNDTTVLDLDTWLWVRPNIKGSLPHERSVHTCNMVEDKLFVIGGIDSTRRFKDIYTLNLTNLVHIEDTGSGLSGRRPRRSSRASPRVAVTQAVAPVSPSTTAPQPIARNELHKSMEEVKLIAAEPHHATYSTSIIQHPPQLQTMHPPLSVIIPSQPSPSPISIPDRLAIEDGSKSPRTPPTVPSPMRSPVINGSRRSMELFAEANGRLTQQHTHSQPAQQNSADSIAVFLTNLGLQRLIPKFEAEEIDVSVLPLMTDEHFEQLGVNTLGAKLRLSKAIQGLRNANLSSVPSNPYQLTTMTTANASLGVGTATPGSVFGLPRHSSPLPPTSMSPSPFLTNHNLVPPPYAPPYGSSSSSITSDALEASVERLVSTVLIATNTLTETMHYFTTKLNNGNKPTSSTPTTSSPTGTLGP